MSIISVVSLTSLKNDGNILKCGLLTLIFISASGALIWHTDNVKLITPELVKVANLTYYDSWNAYYFEYCVDAQVYYKYFNHEWTKLSTICRNTNETLLQATQDLTQFYFNDWYITQDGTIKTGKYKSFLYIMNIVLVGIAVTCLNITIILINWRWVVKRDEVTTQTSELNKSLNGAIKNEPTTSTDLTCVVIE